jgi:hypothetical protein
VIGFLLGLHRLEDLAKEALSAELPSSHAFRRFHSDSVSSETRSPRLPFTIRNPNSLGINGP